MKQKSTVPPAVAKVAGTGKAKPSREPSAQTLNRRQRLTEEKRSAILAAGLDIFSRFGMHGTRLEQVATQADVSKTNLLYYFNSKEDLYLNVLRQVLEVWVTPLKVFSIERDPVQAISAYLKAKLVLSRDHPAESRLFCMEIMQGAPILHGELQHPLRDTVEAKVAVIQHWIDSGQVAAVNPQHLVFSLWAMTQHYADFRVQVEAITGKTLHDPAFFDDVLESLCGLVLNGVRPRP